MKTRTKEHRDYHRFKMQNYRSKKLMSRVFLVRKENIIIEVGKKIRAYGRDLHLQMINK